MYKTALIAVTIVLLAYGASIGQCDHSIFVAYQDDLPHAGSPYNPCGNTFSYVFVFDVVRYSSTENNAIIYPQVISSQLNISVNSLYYTPGTGYSVDGDGFTGSGSDYLQIGIWSRSGPDAFENMDWSVSYYDGKPD